MPGSGLCDGCLPSEVAPDAVRCTGGVGPGVEPGGEGDGPFDSIALRGEGAW